MVGGSTLGAEEAAARSQCWILRSSMQLNISHMCCIFRNH
jgi:hypothetical protein